MCAWHEECTLRSSGAGGTYLCLVGTQLHSSTCVQYDATSAEHDATSAEHDATSAEYDATSAEHDATSAEHDATSAEYDATSAEHAQAKHCWCYPKPATCTHMVTGG